MLKTYYNYIKNYSVTLDQNEFIICQKIIE